MLNDLGKKPKKTQGNRSFNGDTTHLEMVGNSAIFSGGPQGPGSLGRRPRRRNGKLRPRRLLRFSNTSMTRMAKELSKVGEMEGFRVNPGKSG